MVGDIKLSKGKLGEFHRKMVEKAEQLHHLPSELTIEHKISDSKKAVIHCESLETDIFDLNPASRTKAKKPCDVSIVNTKDDASVETDDDKKVGEMLFFDSDQAPD
jgi:hypothetical protein